jgi:hypothetical protein
MMEMLVSKGIKQTDAVRQDRCAVSGQPDYSTGAALPKFSFASPTGLSDNNSMKKDGATGSMSARE